MEHPATLPDKQIDQLPLLNATTSRYDDFSQGPAATAAYLNKPLDTERRATRFQMKSWLVAARSTSTFCQKKHDNGPTT